MKVRKKPVEVETYKIDSMEPLPEWLSTAIKEGTIFASLIPYGLGIKTLEGTMYAQLDDYIIRGVRRELYSCKPDIFAETYEVIQEVRHDRRTVKTV